MKPTAQLVYIVVDADCDYERLFLQIYNISQTFITYLVVVILIMGLHSH